MTRDELRVEALRLANSLPELPADQVVARAQAYLEFLSGKNK